MKRIIVRDQTRIPPFDEPARELRVLNKPLWLLQRDLFKRYGKDGPDIASLADLQQLPLPEEELFVHKDNLFFNAELIDTFIERARAAACSCQIAFLAGDEAGARKGDASIETHALHLQRGIRRLDGVDYLHNGQMQHGSIYVADMYYMPAGAPETPLPLIVETLSGEMGYYHIPSYMARKGDLVYQIPIRAFLSVENWVHLFLANVPMGVFGWGREQDERMSRARLRNLFKWTREDWQALGPKLRLTLTAFWENINPFEEKWRNHFLASKSLVKVGKNCSIDPTAVIHGPTVIGDNVYIGPGTVIANSLIGNNVNIMQGSQIMLSVVSDRCFLPFNAGLFMTTLMDNSMVAQNSTLQLCVVGRNTFIGANNCFTDFDLLGNPIHTIHEGDLSEVGLPVLGSAVGHNCKIGSGFIVYPGRMIGSGAVLLFDHDDNLVRRNVPGNDPDDVDDVTGEPRRIYYRWPKQYDPHTGTISDPPPADNNGTAPQKSLREFAK
jgi:UDP-N-acetylglucosamine diphosphorylase / glucose-1-phosphate thymidylyltransferase / UDP-N-acetylgalactosamine diphosphorylase / glucosamine-1-phosphate N-acetyltransferase / galactosamine-1-phosphate N-acetyltransferase